MTCCIGRQSNCHFKMPLPIKLQKEKTKCFPKISYLFFWGVPEAFFLLLYLFFPAVQQLLINFLYALYCGATVFTDAPETNMI